MGGKVESTVKQLLRKKMTKKKPNVTQQVAIRIRQVTASIITNAMIPKYGVGYRVADIVRHVRLLMGTSLTPREWLKAIAKWLDDKIATFNNRYFNPTPKGHTTILKAAAA